MSQGGNAVSIIPSLVKMKIQSMFWTSQSPKLVCKRPLALAGIFATGDYCSKKVIWLLFSPLNLLIILPSVTPECLYHHLIRHSWIVLSTMRGQSPLIIPKKTDSLRRKIKRLKEKQKMQKTTEGGFFSLSGFPIKDFGNDERGVPEIEEASFFLIRFLSFPFFF